MPGRPCELHQGTAPPAALRVRITIPVDGGGTYERDVCVPCRDEARASVAASGGTVKPVERIRQ